jgi:hypothetical protein
MGVAGDRDDVQIPGGLVTDPVTKTSQNLQLFLLAVYSQKAVIKIKIFKKLCFSFRFSIARI